MSYEREPFRQFMARLSWRQGEHVLLAAPTQCGKSTLASILAARRKAVVVLASKTDDDNLAARYADYARMPEWKPGENRRVLLWPKRERTMRGRIDLQKRVFRDALDAVGRTKGWCVVVDEAHWATQFLRLGDEIAVLHHQGSSSGVSMMVLTQRPAWIPRIIYSSASHVFLGATTDRDDLKALSNLGGTQAKAVQESVANLGRHDLLYLNPMGDGKPAVINIRK